MPTKKLGRLDRLAGDGKNSGGGLPLPPLFQTVVAELVDHDSRTVGDFIAPVEQSIPKMERVNVLYPDNGYEGLVTDVLDQLRSKGLASYADGTWKIGDKFQESKTRIVISERKGKNHAVTVTVYSKEERDRRSAATRDERELRAMYADLRNERTFSVRATFARGRAKRMDLKLHPLARTIPQMSEQEFLDLGADIKANGVRVPIVLFDGQVLDGRHRVAAASALNLLVRLEEFDGDASAHVASLNLMRRQMTVVQKALTIQQLYLPQVESEVKERQGLADGQGQVKVQSTGESTLATPEAEAIKVAVARSHMTDVSLRSMERILPVKNAPQTQERIRRGEIKSVVKAEKEALTELGLTKDTLPAEPMMPYTALGQAIYKLQLAHSALSGRKYDDDRILPRIEELIPILFENFGFAPFDRLRANGECGTFFPFVASLSNHR